MYLGCGVDWFYGGVGQEWDVVFGFINMCSVFCGLGSIVDRDVFFVFIICCIDCFF